MKEILATLAGPSSSDTLPSYEDVTADLGANGSSSSDRPNLRFNPNAVVGKATCIQLKPAGKKHDRTFTKLRNSSYFLHFSRIFRRKKELSKIFFHTFPGLGTNFSGLSLAEQSSANERPEKLVPRPGKV